nr:4Fe-4S ferredoxin [Desulfobacterales bacterium]
ISPRRGPGEDKFMAVYPKIDWSIQLKYGEEIGLGTRKYELIRI